MFPDAWPISKLSGYDVTAISKMKPAPDDPNEIREIALWVY